MSFQAPSTDATPGFKAPDTDEEAPKWSDLPGNIIPDAENTLKSGAETAGRIAKGVYDLPSDLTETARQELTGGNPLETPVAQDVKTVGMGALNAIKAIPKQLSDVTSKEAWIQHPVGNALTLGSMASPFLGGEGVKPPAEMEPGAIVPREAISDAAPAESPKTLPVMEPGSKTGDPHALFAYNDKFGPGGAERSIYNVFGDPEHPSVKGVGHGSSITKADLDKASIPVIGREPRSVGKWEPLDLGDKVPPLEPMMGKGTPGVPPSKMPPDPSAPKPAEPAAKSDPLQDVKNWMASKGEKIAAKPGIVQKIGNFLDEEAAKLGGKDIGLQLGQAKSMGPGYKGLEKAKALIDYARDKGYLSPTLTDTARRTLAEQNMNKYGAQIGALREIADKRGAPPVDAMRNELKTQLEDKFGIDAPGEINKVLAKFDKAAKTPTFSGMADLATELHAHATPATKMGLHPGPTTEGANILARLNNDATRATMNPEESNLFTQNLRDFGAHKKLEQTFSSGGRKALVGRGAPGSATNRVIQEALDRGGYRIGGNIASRAGRWAKAHPNATLPEFFEELGHQSNDAMDETINGMAKGGIVPHDVREWVNARPC